MTGTYRRVFFLIAVQRLVWMYTLLHDCHCMIESIETVTVIMKWISAIAVIVFITPSLGFNFVPSSAGSCASIGYADRCCPRGAECTATDGTRSCTCDPGCYAISTCCQDVFCSPSKSYIIDDTILIIPCSI